MSKKEFDLKKAVFATINDNDVKYPGVPIDIALQEAEDLNVWCRDDKELLIKAGLNWSLVEDLAIRTGACRYAQSLWRKEYRSLEEAQREWAEKSPEAYELRDELLHHFLYAFRNTADLLARVKQISKGGRHADMIQDLSDLSALGKDNIKLLEVINIDLALLDKAQNVAASISALLAKSNNQKLKDNNMRLVRDKAYAHMKESVDEIRRCGTYVFWKNENRKKGYVSKYNKTKIKKSKAEVEVNELVGIKEKESH